MPNVTPIGTVFLHHQNTSGFFFDKYTNSLSRNIDHNGNICLLAVNSAKTFWLRSFLSGRFASAPGLRLYGTSGALREATSTELEQIADRVRPTRWLKGSRLLWSGFTHVRDLQFTSFRAVSYPKMTSHLWE
jgi:hypothetical protein